MLIRGTRSTEVSVLTYPDRLWHQRSQDASRTAGDSVDYQRIAGLELDDGGDGQSVRLPEAEGKDLTERWITLPAGMASRLINIAGKIAEQPTSYNCHRFSRAITNPDLAELPNPYFSPVVAELRRYQRAKSLPLGAIGLVGVQGIAPSHSLISLGTFNPESLQVMSAWGQLGIADTSQVVDYYQHYWGDKKVHLYQAPRFAIPGA